MNACQAECSAAGIGDSGYQGTHPRQKGHLCSAQVLAASAGSHIPYVIVRPDALCMQRTFKIMSFLSKAGGRERERQWPLTETLQKSSKQAIVTAFKYRTTHLCPILPTVRFQSSAVDINSDLRLNEPLSQHCRCLS